MSGFDEGAFRARMTELRAAIVNGVYRAVRDAVEEGVRHAKSTKLFGDRTGATRESIGGTAFMEAGEFHAAGAARFLEWGTPPHLIEAHSARALKFEVAGETLFRRLVHHPGTAPRPFMTEARDHAEKVLDYGLAYYIGFAIDRFNQG
jgi:hypothetical protein